jgi:mRNA-degrading endonuclease toxin of MazEF toxin-antitoxin module
LMNDQSGVAIVAPLTTTGSMSPWATPVEPAEAGIERRSWIECHQLQALSLSRKRFLRRSRPLAHGRRPYVALALASALRGIFPLDDAAIAAARAK